MGDMFTKCPKPIRPSAGRTMLRKGDLVADAAYVGVPRLLDEGVGRIVSIHADYAKVAWRDGSDDTVHIRDLMRVQDRYEPMIHESAYEIPKYVAGTRVVLGNGDQGRVIAEVMGPTGFKSFKIKIEKSVSPTGVGRMVYATINGMSRIASNDPDVVAAFYRESGDSIAIVGCEIALSESDQRIGLQKYSKLQPDHGMLFPYDPPRAVMFHMGRVSFPIDVVFIDQLGKVAAIEESRVPGVDEQWGHGRVSAVIEVNGGWCQQNGVMIGDHVRLTQSRMAQETFRPDHNRTDHAVRPVDPTMDPNRFKGHDMPSEVLNSGDSFAGAGNGPGRDDFAHQDSTFGRDPTKPTDDSGISGDGTNVTRPS
jgi:uncharacterized membrane protein (UPF0127 family)